MAPPRPVELPLGALEPSSDNPRRAIDPASLAGLVASIKAQGIIQPLVVRPLPGEDARYEIIAGHRRYAAAAQAGLASVPVRILDTDDDLQVQAMRIAENLQRTNLDCIEEATSMERMRTQHGMSDGAIGALIGKSDAWVNRTRRLLDLPNTVQDALSGRRLNTAQGWALQRYRAFPALVERLSLIAQRDSIPGKALDAPFVQAFELEKQGLIVELAAAPAGFDFAQCEACTFKAYFPVDGGRGYCAKPQHFRQLAQEARQRERTGEPVAARPAGPARAATKAPAGAKVPKIVRSLVTQRLAALDRLMEQLRPQDANDPTLRVSVVQHVAALTRIFGDLAPVVESLDQEEVPA